MIGGTKVHQPAGHKRGVGGAVELKQLAMDRRWQRQGC
jgi:hypothetical protein